jgi:Ser/Thr protein kinase RdoA (MazF antagonist)
MENIQRVTKHISKKIYKDEVSQKSRRVLTVVPARDGTPWVRDREGGWWRTYVFIEGAHTKDTVSSMTEAELLGKSVGQFQNQLADLGGERLHETIIDFHNMEFRYRNFHNALEKNEFDRRREVEPEIGFFLKNEERGGILIRSLRSKTIPERICHNDSKLSNILLDDETGEALCVIDLDTVMPGTSLFDLGDLVRTVAITAVEDEPDVSKVSFNPDFFRAILQGYLSEAKGFLTGEEIALLCEAGRNLAHLMGIRFLTDFLEGDHYYQTTRPGHNLDRCRTQIAMIKSMDEQWEIAENIVRELVLLD